MSNSPVTKIATENFDECPQSLPWYHPRRLFQYQRYHVPSESCAHHTHVVVDWLNNINQEKYIPNFVQNNISARTLLSLTSAELKHIGVDRLADRRTILDEIELVKKEPVPEFLHNFTTEHGRILTHLSNDRLLLIWLRIAIVMLIAAVGSLRLGREDPDAAPTSFIKFTSMLLALMAIIITFYASFQFYSMLDMADRPIRKRQGHRIHILFPSFLVFITVSISLYAVTSERTNDAIYDTVHDATFLLSLV